MEMSRRRKVEIYSKELTSFCKDNESYLNLLKDHVDELEQQKQYEDFVKQSRTDSEVLRQSKASDPRNLAVMFTQMDPADEKLFKEVARHGDYEDMLTQHRHTENPFCYLCSTLEQHKKHLVKSEKKIHGKKRIPYEAPAPFVPPKPPPEKPQSKDCLFRVTIKTGTDIKAACSAPVYITLRGEEDTLRRARLSKKFGSLAFFFDSGSTEVFHLRGPVIGRLTEMMLAMDPDETDDKKATTLTTMEAGKTQQQHQRRHKRYRWLVDSISVKDYGTGLEYQFNIDAWLRSGRRESVCMAPTATAKSLAQNGRGILVTTYTGKKATSGTDCRVYISLMGTNGSRGRHELRQATVADVKTASEAIFKPNSKDVFELYVEDFGDLKGIRLELDTHSVRQENAEKNFRMDRDRTAEHSKTWFVDQVIVRDIKTGKKWLFTVSDWLNEDTPSKEFWTVKDVSDQFGLLYGQTTLYEVVTKTGKKDFAGTDSTIFLTLFDRANRKCEIQLKDEDKSRFEKGKTDTIKETARVIDTPVRLRVSISGTGIAPDWYMDGIQVTKYLVTDEILQYLQRLQFSNKMPDGLTHEKGKILFEAADAREKQRRKNRHKADDERGNGRKNKKKERKDKHDDKESDKNYEDGAGVFGRRRRSRLRASRSGKASRSSGSDSSSDSSSDSISDEASDTDKRDDASSNESVKSHDDYDPGHGTVQLPYAVQVSFAPRSKDEAWLKKDKTVELQASNAGKMLYRELRLRSDNENFERLRQEMLEKQRAEEAKKKRQKEKRQRKLLQQQEKRRAAAASRRQSSKSGSRRRAASGRSSSDSSSSSSRDGRATGKASQRRPLSKSPGRGGRRNSDSDSSVNAFGHSKAASQKLKHKKAETGEAADDGLNKPWRSSVTKEADSVRGSSLLRSSRAASSSGGNINKGRLDSSRTRSRDGLDLDRDRDRTELDKSRGRLDFDKGPEHSPRGIDRDKDRLEKGSPKDLDNSRGRLDLDRDRTRGSLDRDRDPGKKRATDLSKGKDSAEVAKGRGHLDLNQDPMDLSRGRGRLDLDRDRGPLDSDRGRVRLDLDRDRDPLDSGRGRSRLDLDRDRDPLDSGRGRSRLDLDRDRDPLNSGRGRGRLELDRDRDPLDSSRGRGRPDLDRGRDPMDSSRERGRLDPDRGTERSNLSKGRGGLEMDRDREPLDRRRGLGHLEFDRDRDYPDLSRGSGRLNLDRRGGSSTTAAAASSASHDKPRIVLTATDGRQADPIVARSSGRVRQRSFNLD